jgi:hypothetical protein
MKEDECKEVLIDLMGALIGLRTQLKKRAEKKDEDEDVEDHKDRKLKEEIRKDFNGFFRWSLDLDPDDRIKHSELVTKWKELHPDLPVPRSALMKYDCDPSFALFIMDGYPLYLKHREKE